MVRLGEWLARVQQLPIRSRLIALLAAPMLTLAGIGLVVMGASAVEAFAGRRVEQVSRVAADLATLTHELQVERGLASAQVAAGRRGDTRTLRQQQARVDHELVGLERRLGALQASGAYTTLRQGVQASGLDRLAEARQRVASDPKLGAEAALELYRPMVQGLLAVTASLADDAGDERLLRRVSAAVAMARAKDAAALEQATVNAAAAAGRFTPGQQRRLVELAAAQQIWLAQFQAFATPQQQVVYQRLVGGADVEDAERLRQATLAGGVETVAVDPAEWDQAMTTKLERMRQVELRLAGDVAAAGQAISATATRQATLTGLALTVVVALVVAVSVWLARSMTGPLAQLTRSARHVADRQLPEVVARMQRAEPVDVDAELLPAPVAAGGEIGQVAAAFAAVQQVAVRIAAEQAAMRRSVSDLILNLARRSQALVDRLLERVDELERDETDPDALARLFDLDHLATRMRRTAENLIVFSGAEQAHRWGEPVPITDILDAVRAEVEDYQRVTIAGLDEVEVAGRAAGDLTHLLAELIDNATAFSPPHAPVAVAGQLIGRGYLIEIEDRGIGMTLEDLEAANRRLADPPAFDFSVRQRLGLFVVARLAKRYDIRLQLRRSAYDGITALVLLPDALLPSRHDRADGPPDAAPAPGRQLQVVGATAPAVRQPIVGALRPGWRHGVGWQDPSGQGETSQPAADGDR